MKLKIIEIGNFDECGWPINWVFAGIRKDIGIKINARGEYTLAGWPLTELRIIYEKKVEIEKEKLHFVQTTQNGMGKSLEKERPNKIRRIRKNKT